MCPPEQQKQDFMHLKSALFVAIVALKPTFAEKRVHDKRCNSHEASKFTGLARTD
jgi:hypothetical protein